MVRRLVSMAVVVCATFVLAAPVAAQVKGLYYQETTKDGRIYVFNTPERYKLWQASGDMGTSITLIGRGPTGETVVAENDTAIDLFLFKHGLPAYDRPTPPPPKPPAPSFPQVKIGGLWYLSYQDGDANASDYSRFTIKRGYINVEAKITPWMSARITPDTTIDSSGDIKVRLKYAYAKFAPPDFGFVAKPEVEVGVAHTPWLDFEEHINAFRLQDTMFMERNGLFNSADIGVTFMGLLGGTVAEEHQKTVSKAYPGTWGSFAFGVYNGGGYHASEANTNKVLEGRLTIRPLPEIAPGLQISYFGVRGKGNTAKEPDWNLDSAMVSYEHARFVLTGTLADGEGNQKGDAVDAAGNALLRDGWSVFGEAKLTPKWGLIARYDVWDPNTDAEDDGNERTIAGIVYHLGKGNDVLLDVDTVSYEKVGKPDDSRVQLTLQVNF